MEVGEKIRNGNPWYVASHLQWAQNPSIQPIFEKRYEFIVDCIERAGQRLGHSLRLLDAGCGDGYWLSRLSGLHGINPSGVEYNPTRVQRVRQTLPNVPIHCCDLSTFSSKKPFDVVLLNQVIEHINDDSGLLGNMRKLLRRRGVLILGTPNEGSWLQQWRNRRLGQSFQTDHTHFYTEQEVRRKVVNAGFNIDRVMREVFYVGDDRIYYQLTKRRWGFRFLELLTKIWPSGCSDMYFECRAS